MNKCFNLPKKLGDLYVQYDEYDKPIYGLKVKGNKIEEFISLSNQMPDYIVLPNFNPVGSPRETDFLEYIVGEVRIEPECFANLGDVNLILPSNTSVMFMPHCVDNNAKVKVIAPVNIDVKCVLRGYDNGGYFQYEKWPLLADKKTKSDKLLYEASPIAPDGFYSVDDYEKDELYSPLNITVSKKYYVSGNKILEREAEAISQKTQIKLKRSTDKTRID